MTTPGRAVIIVTRQRLAARSIKILGTAAPLSFFFSRSRISRSSVSSALNSFLLAYHLERQSLLTATRRPIGFVFWPMELFVGQGDFDVATALDDRPGGTARLGGEPLEARRRARNRLLDSQTFRLELVVVLRVGDGRFQGLGNHPRALARNELQHRLRLQRRETLDLPH